MFVFRPCCIILSLAMRAEFLVIHWYIWYMIWVSPKSTLCVFLSCLTHWGRVMHICASKLTSIGSDNGLSPGRHQAIIWSNAGIFLIWPLGTNFSKILIEIHTSSFKKMHLKMSSGKWRPFCLGLNVSSKQLLTLACPLDVGANYHPLNTWRDNNVVITLKRRHFGAKTTSLLSGVPDYFGRNKISSGGDLSHYSSASLY